MFIRKEGKTISGLRVTLSESANGNYTVTLFCENGSTRSIGGHKYSEALYQYGWYESNC